MLKLLVCGTRKKSFDYNLVCYHLNKNYEQLIGNIEIIEGCCPKSADIIAEEWAKQNKIKVNHFPSTIGNYLKRNIEMVNLADEVLCFWDKFSYGTCHTIAHAVKKGIPIKIIEVN